MTGQLEEEKMQVYVRLGIRLLYKASSNVSFCTLGSGTTSLRLLFCLSMDRVPAQGWRVREVCSWRRDRISSAC
jgi:hypothetical protein